MQTICTLAIQESAHLTDEIMAVLCAVSGDTITLSLAFPADLICIRSLNAPDDLDTELRVPPPIVTSLSPSRVVWQMPMVVGQHYVVVDQVKIAPVSFVGEKSVKLATSHCKPLYK